MQSQVIRISGGDTRDIQTKLASRHASATNAEQADECAKKGKLADLGSTSTSSPQFVRRILAARAARRHFFDGDLFADPAWDILLELYALHCEQRRTSVSKLCIAAAVPGTTALRWIEKLQADGLLTRHEDPLDRRRVWVTISRRGLVAMRSFLEELSPAAMPL